MMPITCVRPSPPRGHSPSSPTTRHVRSNIRSTSISMPSAISWNAASQNSSSSAVSQPALKRRHEITVPSSLSPPSSYGCDKCPHHLGDLDVFLAVLQLEPVAVAAQHHIALVEGLQRRAMADRDDGGGRQFLLDQFVKRRLRGFVERGRRFIEEQILR